MSDDGPAPSMPYEEYAAEHPEAGFTGWLRDGSEPAWSAAVTHRFTDEIARGTVDEAVFRRYLLDDYAFVTELTGLVGYAVGQAPDPDARARLAEFLGTLTGDESDYFERAFAALDVPSAAYAEPRIRPVAREFRTLLGRAAREGGYAETLSVLLPVEWIYREWATRAASRPDRWYLAEWIDVHATDEFAAFVDWLRDQLDALGPELAPRRRRGVERLFGHAVDLEVAFFDAAYDTDDGTARYRDAGDRPGAGGDTGGDL